MDNEKIEKYSSRLHAFSPDVKKWLIDLYSQHYHLLNFTLKHIIDKNEYFLLCYSEEEFEIITIECLSKLTRKYTYLRDKKHGILLFIKDLHRIENLVCHDDEIPKLPLNIERWINETMNEYNVEIRTFAARWCHNVMFNKSITKPKVSETILGFHELDKEFHKAENLFGINELYRDLYNKPFMIDKKQELLTLMVYYWAISFGDINIWFDYLTIF